MNFIRRFFVNLFSKKKKIEPRKVKFLSSLTEKSLQRDRY